MDFYHVIKVVSEWGINRKISIKTTLVSNSKKKKGRIVVLDVLSFYIVRMCGKHFDYIIMTKGCSLPKKLRLLYDVNLAELKLVIRIK